MKTSLSGDADDCGDSHLVEIAAHYAISRLCRYALEIANPSKHGLERGFGYWVFLTARLKYLLSQLLPLNLQR